MKIDKRKIHRLGTILTGLTGSTSLVVGVFWLFIEWCLGLAPLSAGLALLSIGILLMVITFYLDFLYYK